MHPALAFSLKAAAVIAVVAVIAVAVAYFAPAFAVSRKRKRCPACGAKKLRFVRSIRVTGLKGAGLTGGKMGLDSWSYFECEACHTHQKLHRGEFSIVADDEWRHRCISSDAKNI